MKNTLIVNIAYEVEANVVKQIKAHLDSEAMNNCNWNGVEFIIKRDDFTSIDDDSAEACSLYCEIIGIIYGE